MPRHLDHIVSPLRSHLLKRKLVRLPQSLDGQLPPPLEVARLCGESLLRLKFFGLMKTLNHTDYARQLALWDQLVANGGYILDLVQRIELFFWLKVPAGSNPRDWAYAAYCIFLHSLHGSGNSQLFELATGKFLYHHYLGLYPKSATSKKIPAEQLRQRALVRLRKRWGLAAELKESFVTDDKEGVQFSLRIKPQGEGWHTLLTEQGERLKPTRLAAYNRLLQEMEEGKHQPEERAADIV